MDYEEMLKSAQTKMPESALSRDRFEVPPIQGHVEGTRTVLSNFHVIAQVLRRDIDHFQKFILKELATPGSLRSNEFILGRKISSVTINEKIRKYVDQFVLCSECGRPDTDLTKDKKITVMICKACGARKPIKDFM